MFEPTSRKFLALEHGTMYTGFSTEVLIEAQESVDFNFNFPSVIGKIKAPKVQHIMENFYKSKDFKKIKNE